MWKWLPELVAAMLLPCLWVQGKRTRRNTPRLPEAAGERSGIAQPPQDAVSEQMAELIVIGESPVAGVGVATQAQALPAQLAWQLARHWQHRVRWKAYGKNGATVAQALQQGLPVLSTPASLYGIRMVVIVFGVNDSTAFHSTARYQRDLEAMLSAVQLQYLPDLVVISGVPPLHLFPALPQPLRFVLGLKARTLSRVTEQLAYRRSQTLFVPVAIDTGDPSLMATDGYHPSAIGVAQWSAQLAEAVLNYQKTSPSATTSLRPTHRHRRP
jgi:lysophospholipase L1-like esterase